jgi:CheY-like chemotaxis protein
MSSAPPPTPAAAHATRGHETILLVEDEEAVRGLAQRILADQGYKVLTAGDGREALQLYRTLSEPIHLIITDVVMPEMSGKELVDALAAHVAQSAPGSLPRILYCSGYPDSAHLHGLLPPGAAFLEKPFTPDSLTQKVREVLER